MMTNNAGKMEKNGCKWSESEIYLVMIVTQLRDHLKEWCSNGKPRSPVKGEDCFVYMDSDCFAYNIDSSEPFFCIN